MELIAILFATISITSSVVSSSTFCSNVTPAHLNLYYSKCQFIPYINSLHECVKICRSLHECKAISYSLGYTGCLIHHADTSTLEPSQLLFYPETVIYDKAAWNMGPCSVHNCGANERCYPTGASYVCKKAVDVCFNQVPVGVCFNQVPVGVCFRRYDIMTMDMYAADYNMGESITHTLSECVMFCNIHHPTYKVLYFSLIYHECYCLSVSVADYKQQVGHFWSSTGDTYEKIN